ncbi:uncharacterized protein SPSC_03834 [Sporisorium scitamineum]|uniref:Uncharacterized protein n=1 Tax=Sporisorium scitamineum TaxID=49012 RepID=A0A127Z2X0_9BASI|nr:uncharacterized protein SPSC_03834 [Sporisorium scitamineum]
MADKLWSDYGADNKDTEPGSPPLVCKGQHLAAVCRSSTITQKRYLICTTARSKSAKSPGTCLFSVYISLAANGPRLQVSIDHPPSNADATNPPNKSDATEHCTLIAHDSDRDESDDGFQHSSTPTSTNHKSPFTPTSLHHCNSSVCIPICKEGKGQDTRCSGSHGRARACRQASSIIKAILQLPANSILHACVELGCDDQSHLQQATECILTVFKYVHPIRRPPFSSPPNIAPS